MGLKRLLWRSTTVGNTIDTIKNIVEEKNVFEGLKRTQKETWTEDVPITAEAYKMGTYDGKKCGYEEASAEYEKKMLQQADEFISQRRIYETERDKYEQLLNEYNAEIDRLEQTVNRTEAENQLLQELLLRERRLKALV